MIEINELSRKLSAILNGLDDETSSIFNPATSFDFVVKTYGTHLDSIANNLTKKNFIPVYIANFSGSVQPIPSLREEDLSYDIYIYFPLKYKDTFFRMGNFLIDCFAGKMINFGEESGYALTNLNSPTLADVQQNEFNSFQEFISENYGLPIQRTELWGVMTFSIYFHQVANLGKSDGFITGNQVKHEMSFTYDKTEYKEELVVVSGARNLNSDTISEQRIYQLQTSGIAKNTSYIDSIQAYARDNDFWRKFIELYETGLLQNMVFDYTKIYNLSRRMTFKKKAYLTQCPSSDSLGETKTFTFTFIKPVGSGQDIVDIESKLRIPRITTYAMFEDFALTSVPKIEKRIAIMEFVPWLEDPVVVQKFLVQDFGYLDVPTTLQVAKWFDYGRLNEAPQVEAKAIWYDYGSLKVPVTQQEAIWEGFGYLSRPTHESKAIYQTYGYLESGQIKSQAIWQFYGELDIPTSTAKAIYQDFGYLDIPRHSEKFVIQFTGDLDLPILTKVAKWQDFGYLDLPKTESKAVFETSGNLSQPTIASKAVFETFTQALPPIISNLSIQNTQIVNNQVTIDSTSWSELVSSTLVQTRSTYPVTQFIGGSSSKNIIIKTGIEKDENGDIHLHFFTRERIRNDNLYSEARNGYMYGRKEPTTIFNDGIPNTEPNVAKVNYTKTGDKGFGVFLPNQNTGTMSNIIQAKSINAYSIKKQDIAPQIEVLYYDVNLGNSQTVLNFVFITALALANTTEAFKGNFTLFNNGEYTE